jgi:hypothetical protein
VAAVRAILSTLNGLAQGRTSAGRVRPRQQPGPWEDPYAHAGPEPLLEDLLGDPLIRLLMRADHVEPAEMRRLLGLRPPPLLV